MKWVTFFTVLLYSQVSNSQDISGEAVKSQLVKEWEMAKTMTNEYLESMPADKYSFKPQDSIRSFAQQMLHMAQVTNAMISHGTGASRIFSRTRNLERSTGAQVKDSVMYYVNTSYKFAISAIKNMDASKLGDRKSAIF